MDGLTNIADEDACDPSPVRPDAQAARHRMTSRIAFRMHSSDSIDSLVQHVDARASRGELETPRTVVERPLSASLALLPPTQCQSEESPPETAWRAYPRRLPSPAPSPALTIDRIFRQEAVSNGVAGRLHENIKEVRGVGCR